MTDYENENKVWRQTQEKTLKSDDGWLTVVGLHWLKEGENRVGSKFATPILLPKAAPAELGVFVKKDKSVKIKFITSKSVLLEKKAVTEGSFYDLKTDASAEPTIVQVGSIKLFLIERPNGIGVRVKDSNADARKNFKGRKWYDIDPKFRIEAKWVEFNPPKKIVVPDILGNMNEEDAPGEAQFEHEGQKVALTPTKEGDKLFFVFKDQTSGKETYGAARFLSADLPKNGKVILDFNRAVNPPCAFTDYATCPMPPAENRLAVAIRAGELKTY